jgi:peptide/nickel transport system permease protein
MTSFKVYATRRLIQLPIVLMIVVVLMFIITRSAPGDPVLYWVGPHATDSLINTMRARLGLDRPMHEQFIIYISSLLRGDLGTSVGLIHGFPVIDLIIQRLPNTLLLMGTAHGLVIAIGIFLGVLSSKKPYGKLDVATTIVALVTYSMPVFFLGILLMLFFSLYLGLFPSYGISTYGLTGLPYVFDVLRHLFLPALTIALGYSALYFRLTRTNMLEVLETDYIRTARAKGASENAVFYKHALRNAMIPIVTQIGTDLGMLVAGAVLTETVFAWPGIGRLAYDAMVQRDYPVIYGIFLISTISVVIATFITDIVLAYVDPRIRYK